MSVEYKVAVSQTPHVLIQVYAVENNIPIGRIILEELSKGILHLNVLMVKEKSRGQGVGRYLLKKALEEVDKLRLPIIGWLSSDWERDKAAWLSQFGFQFGEHGEISRRGNAVSADAAFAELKRLLK